MRVRYVIANENGDVYIFGGGGACGYDGLNLSNVYIFCWKSLLTTLRGVHF